MKTYQKPIMIALSLTGNEQLCGSCAAENNYLLKDDPELANRLVTSFGLDKNGNGADRADFANVFGGSQDGGCTKIVVGYCKFTMNQLVAWS